MKLTYSVEGGEELRRAINKLSADNKNVVKGETQAHGIKLQDMAKRNLKALGRWDTGNLANSIILDMENSGFTAKVEATAPYAVYVENGTRPHFPPLDALEDWARRHGFDSAWPICLAISKKGIPETPFMSPAFDKISKEYYGRLKKLVER